MENMFGEIRSAVVFDHPFQQVSTYFNKSDPTNLYCSGSFFQRFCLKWVRKAHSFLDVYSYAVTCPLPLALPSSSQCRDAGLTQNGTTCHPFTGHPF
jgi:hypothetical protein